MLPATHFTEALLFNHRYEVTIRKPILREDIKPSKNQRLQTLIIIFIVKSNMYMIVIELLQKKRETLHPDVLGNARLVCFIDCRNFYNL